MRFKAQIQNITTFTKFVASLTSLGPVAWVRLNENDVRFTIIPEQGTQVWAVLAIDAIFEGYTIQSAAENVINLEVPLGPLHQALKSALQATAASIRLTKKDNIPLLSITIVRNSIGNARQSASEDDDGGIGIGLSRERETTITQDVPVRVLSPSKVEGIHEPRCRDPDVHIILPPLMQLKSISDRFTKVALESRSVTAGLSAIGPRLEMAANMHGCLRLGIKTDAMKMASLWTGLDNPELDPSHLEGGMEEIQQHPSTRMKQLGGPDGQSEEGWAKVRLDGKDWGKVMSVGRLGGRVIACFCHEHALILYVYLPSERDEEESALTYYISSYSA
ncbi:Hus1-like protein [Trichodelitschia bisporula]|uniref:Checkpoint protein n=1 Tax=Trichodelitschia bisporula TaxID=703511 RepID=A0A6G1HMN7_9PEZI|nr:Hus1-like protein [Trichodelitschia bisporula]